MDFVEADSWEVFRKIDITLSHIYWRPPVYEFVSLIKRHQIITVGIFWNSTRRLLLSSEIIK